MVDPRVMKIGESLKEEEKKFVDYPFIEGKTAELGFPTSLRTLRFYVNEGVLPPPKKLGKAPVYEEDWILKVLLAIHLMKTRLNRSLSEIRAILQNLNEDPSILADKCHFLYAEYLKGKALSRVEVEWLIDTFFKELTGSPRPGGPDLFAGERPMKQPSEVCIVDIAEDIEKNGEWISNEQGIKEWISPDAKRLQASKGRLGKIEEPSRKGTGRRRGFGFLYRQSRDGRLCEVCREALSAREKKEACRGCGRLVICQRCFKERNVEKCNECRRREEVPEGAVLREEARELEEIFIQGFEANFKRIDHIRSPLDGKVYGVAASDKSHFKANTNSEIVEIMREYRLFDKNLLERMPLNETSKFKIIEKPFLGRARTRLVIAAGVLSPLEEYILKGYSNKKLDFSLLDRFIKSMAMKSDSFYFLGVFSTTGWERELKENPPRGQNWSIVLVEKNQGGGWKIFGGEGREGCDWIFDPESEEEKIERCVDYLRTCDDLKVRGGFVFFHDVEETLGVPRPIVEKGLLRIREEDPAVQREEVEGREIIKRSRI